MSNEPSFKNTVIFGGTFTAANEVRRDNDIIDDIVDKASGHFIYASTVLRFIADLNVVPAQRFLRIINAWSQSSSGNVKPDYSPYTVLDNLYHHILSTFSNIENTLAFLGASIAHGIDHNRYLPIWLKSLPSPSIALLEKLFMLQEGDGFLAVQTIQSLVEILPDGSIQFYHKSFQDFMLDSNRSGQYCVEIDQSKRYQLLAA
ncbi:hypothetical protein BDN70DRAFT_249049 [Pholiota conissans]|uniref:Uncharacterized protein n=1 Tax=Pholiota conissans TaxID=109636 RepID=A0A9P5YX68_9AGAR|nr:hypothetical protein BDN70DRAFT_249049 [Pholiota conissans]